jgi:hypothetical protein
MGRQRSGPALSGPTLASGLAVFTALVLTTALLGYLLRDGFLPTRVLLFVAVAGLAWASVLGVVRDRPAIGTAGAVGVVLLGFWQAVLWIWLLPTAGLLLGAVVLSTRRRDTHCETTAK